MVKIQHWRNTSAPTLEINTTVPAAGCTVDCTFCPQRVLTTAQYAGDRVLSFENFKMVIDRLPKEIRVTFSGYTEPWLNKRCTDMLLYAYEAGHEVSGFTTGVGMTPEDVYRLRDVKFNGNSPNGGFVLHLPDQERIAKHPLNANYIKVIEAFKEIESELSGFSWMSMGPVHEAVSHIYPNAYVPTFMGRAGNLTDEEKLKPELTKLEYITTTMSDTPMTCGCVEGLYHPVMLPNGNVSLCCEDYSLKHILGNLFEQDYDDIVPKPNTCFTLCGGCENRAYPSVDIPLHFEHPKASKKPELDWGLFADNEWFRNTLEGEILNDKAYLKYFDVERGDIVVDVGASIGIFSHTILDKKPSAIYCLEPHKELFKTLSSNLEITGGNTRIHLVNNGISSNDGHALFAGLYDETGDGISHNASPLPATGIKLMTFVRKYNIKKIDFLKTDCEGGEYDMFTEDNLDWVKNNVRKIAGEFHLHNPEMKQKFRAFRDLYLKEFENHQILSMDYVDIKHSLWSDWFISNYSTINLYIDNR